MQFDIPSLMAQAQQLMKEFEDRKAAVEAELAEATVTGSAGAGAVEISLSGDRQVRRVKIDRSKVDPSDVELLEDLVFSALADALRRVEAINLEKYEGLSQSVTIGGMDLGSIKDLLG
ncbi:MAG: YbaB/EbfC family nucleoid-associated protein [bacterium]|jgi:hypothetical protein